MASDGVSSCSRRSGGVGREEKFAEGSGPMGKDGKDGVSPKCFCGEHAILFMSKTSSNPNRLFFNCPFFISLELSDSGFQGEKEFGDVEEHQWNHDMENKINCIEKRIEALEWKKNPIRWCIYVILIVLIAAILSRAVPVTIDGAFAGGLKGWFKVGAGGLPLVTVGLGGPNTIVDLVTLLGTVFTFVALGPAPLGTCHKTRQHNQAISTQYIY
ncbi:hypothetical protein Ahy_B06g084606 [Arachis hypogaea]|uniref:Zinc finger GRF-type domain-containing protein n=1 Tax=Arachis hypogaea TaxID=3818 RepID=A0A444YSD6_ARAHY|nr:hypothetical protein Ahy_B06g084606 [Arachis hypogaea]